MLEKPPLLIHINRGSFFKTTASVNLLTEAVVRRAAWRLLTEAVRDLPASEAHFKCLAKWNSVVVRSAP